jgi:hypothetical protein
VDYLGLAHELKAVLATGTESGAGAARRLTRTRRLPWMLEEHEVCCALLADSTGRGGRAGRHSSGSACCPPRRSTSCARRTAHPGHARAVPRLRAGHAPSRGVARPRRRGVSSRPCGWCWPSAPRRHPAAGGGRPRRPADHLPRRGSGGRRGHLRGGRATEERRAGAVLRGDAGADDPPLPTGRSRRRR